MIRPRPLNLVIHWNLLIIFMISSLNRNTNGQEHMEGDLEHADLITGNIDDTYLNENFKSHTMLLASSRRMLQEPLLQSIHDTFKGINKIQEGINEGFDGAKKIVEGYHDVYDRVLNKSS